ncbi:hypothetical protein CVS47_00971 [Microbacterium lemovicicum]|uniref:ECF RNA polymerase sigma factor SigI n=1 Tax=Microbacterium lemovicicum TaxID=1072463 RepID=A0A3Q9J1G7_9MICO|nr:DUF6596 domain-containing protein [Microbacterium lemovicicum]AZS36370.1 hypothetical protein CVS47_00971 [Microbacterium lemovicicum]
MTGDAAGRAGEDDRPAASDALLARTVREEAARLVATLTASFRSFDIAEEAVAAAVEEAVRAWRVRGVPPNPGAWLSRAARNNALDRIRREQRLRTRLPLLAAPEATMPDESDPAVDERLPLLFGCCHPALSPDAQLALTLRAVCGLTTRQVARATFSTEPAVAQRIVRAKRKMAASGIPLRIPDASGFPPRLDIALAVVAAMYSEAHLRSGADAAADRDIADDAVWLSGVIVGALPAEPEARGLRALLLLHSARESARAADGELVLLEDQDRTRWDAALIDEAGRELDRAAARRRPGRWQLHAAIAACHADAASSAETDWPQILALYDLLLRHDGSAVVRLNRAVALSRVGAPRAALEEVDGLRERLGGSHLWHAVRAALLRDLGRGEEALAADLTALELTANDAERRLLARRVEQGR